MSLTSKNVAQITHMPIHGTLSKITLLSSLLYIIKQN